MKKYRCANCRKVIPNEVLRYRRAKDYRKQNKHYCNMACFAEFRRKRFIKGRLCSLCKKRVFKGKQNVITIKGFCPACYRRVREFRSDKKLVKLSFIILQLKKEIRK